MIGKVLLKCQKQPEARSQELAATSMLYFAIPIHVQKAMPALFLSACPVALERSWPSIFKLPNYQITHSPNPTGSARRFERQPVRARDSLACRGAFCDYFEFRKYFFAFCC